MYFTGFADEAAASLEGQIKATKDLGWQNIEARNIDGTNIHDLSDEEFDVAYGKLQDAGIKVNCFGSTICNWQKKIDESMTSSIEEAKRAIPRMIKLGTRMIRMMSFAVLRDRDPEDQMEEERFRRVREICKMFTDEGLLPVHENCGNYGGMGYTYSLKLIENVPGLKLVFDTGNPIGTDDRSKPKPYPEQSPWEFYNKVKEHVVYIHIKDAKWNADRTKRNACFPGEGDGDVKEIVTDMLKNGYDGGISIEPHMALSADLPADFKFNNYVEYGRRMMQLVADIKTGL